MAFNKPLTWLHFTLSFINNFSKKIIYGKFLVSVKLAEIPTDLNTANRFRIEKIPNQSSQLSKRLKIC
jgi:hypothetical protein